MRSDICVGLTPANSAAIVAIAKQLEMDIDEENVIPGSSWPYIAYGWTIPCIVGAIGDDRKVVPLEEFIAAMLDQGPKPKIVKIGEHQLTYEKDSVRVGCTTVTREQVEGVLEHMNALRDKK